MTLESVTSVVALPPTTSVLVDFLSTDERPTAILQLRASRPPQITYINPALERIFIPRLRDHFTAWTSALLSENGGSQTNKIFSYAGQEWQIRLLQQHNCAVVHARGQTGEERGQRSENQVKEPVPPRTDANNYDVFEPNKWVTDWIRFPCAAVNSWTKFLRSVAWEKTPVGPMETWPSELCQILIMTMACGDARVIVWGPDGFMFFNEAAIAVVTSAAIPLLGFPIVDMAGEETQLANKRYIQEGLATGTPVKMRRIPYPLHRHGIVEDVFVDFNLLPLTSKTGHYNGLQIEFTEVTPELLDSFRKEIVSALLECVAVSDNLELLWSGLRKVFEGLQAYLPYAMIYTAASEAHNADGVQPVNERRMYRLHSTTGVAAYVTPLRQAFDQALASDEITILKLADGTSHPDLIVERLDGVSVEAVYILPIKAHGEQTPLGFLVLGKNPRQPFRTEDAKMMEFIRETIWRSASIIALPEDQRNKDELIATNNRLAQELRILMVEANESAFATLARDAPCGMYIINQDGTPRFLNQTWLEMTGFSSLEQVKETSRIRSYWSDIVCEEESPPAAEHGADAVFTRILTKGIAQRSEHRLVLPQDPLKTDVPRVFNRWMEAVSLPVFDPIYRIQGIMGFMLDISDRKKAEEVQEQNRALIAQQQALQLQDALANKAAADSFIDTISHELRNPLSAILQVADGASPILESLLSNSSTAQSADAVIEAVKTIILCAQHMKTIVDDILTLSKLDSSLLNLLPESSSPHELAMKALKMYESECLAAGIATSLEIEHNLRGLSVDTVMMDPNRTLQVLMNLLSNAVKFTRDSKTRKITLRLGASLKIPTSEPNGVNFAVPEVAKTHTSSTVPESSPKAEAHSREAVFIQYTVVDTGRGVMQEEIDRLFQRFSQGSSKTYAQYGGSGMGLFISERLSELHGGQIGMKSDGLGFGSTFTFYVKVDRSAMRSASPLLSTKQALYSQNDDSATARVLEPPPAAAVAKTMSVLVVEDNIVNQKITAKQLRRLKHTVHVADNGEEALAFLRKSSVWQQPASVLDSPSNGDAVPISVVLMDVEMPIMDGITCTRIIREMERDGIITVYLPIIAVTANARDEQIKKNARKWCRQRHYQAISPSCTNISDGSSGQR